MFDSIKCHIKLDKPLNSDVFDHHRMVSDMRYGIVSRHWIAKDGIHLNYRHHPQDADGTLSIEVALSHYTQSPRHENPTMRDYNKAINLINEWLYQQVGVVPDVREWTVDRMDYCWNFAVEDVSAYIRLLNQLHCGSLARTSLEHGVTWKNDNRWVKFYDKGKQLGDGALSVLRFEVTNHRSAVRYMCKKWFGCERVLSELLHPVRALYVLHRYLSQLGLHQSDVYEDNTTLHTRIAHLFPARTATALGMYILITQYGADTHRHGLTTSSTYYRWLSRLRTHGLLTTPTHALPVLRLNHSFFIQQHTQNLGISIPPAANPTKKFGWEKFGLKIEPDATLAEVLR